MIEELFEALSESGANAGPEELADILWLAAHIKATGSRLPDGRNDTHHDESTPPSHALQSPPPSAAIQPPPAEQFYSAADMTDAPGSAARNVDLVRIRRAASLRDPLAVMRALRPLGRHAGLPGDLARGELDEELTVRSTIEQGLPVPVIRPRRGRWLDLALVIDTHHSMLLWHDLVTELRRVFVQTGIFRDVRTWYLSDTGPQDVPSVARAGGEPRSVQEVTDPSGHRLVLVVTDTVAGGWNTPALQSVLSRWSSHGPVALLNVLPRRLWDRGAIRPQPHMVRAPRPASPNASWRLGHAAGSRRRQRHREALTGSIAVPVVEVSAGSISKLAELVAGGGRWIRLSCLTVARSPESLAEPQPVGPVPSPEPPAAVDEILRRFRAGASPVAQMLAGYLSAVPLNLPVMNLVRQIMLPESEPGHLAEVALGGLFQSWERAAREERTDLDRMPFRFRTGVREALLGSQRRHEITAVQELVRREMGTYVTQRGSGPAGDFLAARGTAGGNGSQTLASDALPFADRASMPSPQRHSIRDIPAQPDEHPLRYIERDMAPRLREAMGRAVNGHSTLAVLVGEPGSGMTHAAARAIRALPDDWRVWSPDASLTLARGAPDVGPRTVVIFNDLQTYTTVPGFPIEDMARTLRDLIEDTQRAPVMILGTLTPTAWDSLVAMAEGSNEGFESERELRRLIDHAEVIRISPVDATPKRWPDEPSHTRLVMIASTSDPVHAGSGFKQLGTGFLLGPRLILTAAHIQDRRSRLENVKVCNTRGTITADSWVDCRVLWSHDAYDAALLLAENNLAEPATDSHFSLPHWAQLTGDEPLSPCHITGVTVANRPAPQASGHLTGALYPSPSHLEAAYEFEPSSPLPRSLEKAMAGAPVFSEGFLLGFVIGRSAGSRLAVAGISTLVSEGDFIDFCSPYMPRIPRLDLLSAPSSAPAEDNPVSDVPAGHVALRVFVSYAHKDDDGAHAEQVHRLCNILRYEGFDVRLDRDALPAPQDWTAWMRHEMREADVIMVIASPLYKRRFEDPEADSSVGVAYEARLLRNELAHAPESGGWLVLPVLLPGSTVEDLPDFLRSLRPIVIDSISLDGIDQVVARLSEARGAGRIAPAELALRHSALAEQHWLAGRHAEALDSADQAIEIYRQLASDRSALYQPALVSALVTKSDRLADIGSSTEALQAAREAVDISESLTQSDPNSVLPDLGGALSTLSNRLADIGNREEALEAAYRAVAIRQQLADAAGPTYLSDFARSLSNLSNRLADLGRHEEALSAINEAVVLYRQLAEADPNASLPDLATTLSNSGVLLRETGQLMEAVNALEEAVHIWRALANADPDAALPGLSSALLNLGAALSETGRYEEALVTTEESVILCRELAEISPVAFGLRLATALHNLGLRLSEVQRDDEALAAIDEAITAWRSHMDTRSYAVLPDLAQSLTAAAWLRTRQGGDLDLAADEVVEAVDIFRQLAGQSPTVFDSDLNQALAVQDEVLEALGRPGEADQIRSHTPSTTPAPQPVIDLSNLVNAARHDPGESGTSPSYAGVKTVQKALIAEGLLDAEYAHGHFGTATVAAYAAWQRRLGFAGADTDGIPGKTSLRRLGQRHGFEVTGTSKRSRPADQQADDAIEVLLVVPPDPEMDPEAEEQAARSLRTEIADLDIESVRPGPSAPAPDGAMGIEDIAPGAIAVALSPSSGAFTALIETVRSWLARSSGRHRVSLTIDGDTIELERATDAERRDLIEAYIRRHTDSS